MFHFNWNPPEVNTPLKNTVWREYFPIRRLDCQYPFNYFSCWPKHDRVLSGGTSLSDTVTHSTTSSCLILEFMQQNSGWGVEVTLEFRVLLAWVLISVLVLRSNSMNGRCRSSMGFYHLKTPISRLIWMVFGTESFVPWPFKGRTPRYLTIHFFQADSILNDWESFQTTHFSKVEEFDLVFKWYYFFPNTFCLHL